MKVRKSNGYALLSLPSSSLVTSPGFWVGHVKNPDLSGMPDLRVCVQVTAYGVCLLLSGYAFLLDNQHFPGGGIITCGQVIEVHTACHLFTQSVSAIPVDRLRPTLVDRGNLMPNIERADNLTV